MKLIADFHTHSKFSRFFHGKSTIEEIAYRANELGLKEVAVTDHGYKHLFGTTKDKLYDAKIIVDEVNKWSKTKVLLGIEADILDENGTLDIDAETLALLDVLIVGYHRLIKTDFANLLGKQNGANAKQKATNAFLNAISKYPITILSHLNSVLDLDLYQIGKACAEKNVLVEINNRHPEWTQEQIYDLLSSGCMFVLSSDAHNRDDVGEVDEAMNIMLKYNIPSERIVNVEFAENEKTEEHKKMDEIYAKYADKLKFLSEEEEENRITSNETDSSKPGLSREMEDELEKIANEYGYKYTRPVRRDEEEESVTSNDTETEQNAETENGNTQRFLNAINTLSDALGEDKTQSEQVEVNEQAGFETGVETETGSNEVEDTSKTESGEQGEEETKADTEVEEAESEEAEVEEVKKPRPYVNKNKVEINRNEVKKPKKEETKVKSDEVINLFSVNVSQKQSKEKREELEREVKESKTPKKPKTKQGTGFVNFSNFTDKEDK